MTRWPYARLNHVIPGRSCWCLTCSAYIPCQRHATYQSWCATCGMTIAHRHWWAQLIEV